MNMADFSLPRPWRVESYAWPSALLSAVAAALAVVGLSSPDAPAVVAGAGGVLVALAYGALAVWFGRYEAAHEHYGDMVEAALAPLLRDMGRIGTGDLDDFERRWQDYMARRACAASLVRCWAHLHAGRPPFTPYAPVRVRSTLPFYRMGEIFVRPDAAGAEGGAA